MSLGHDDAGRGFRIDGVTGPDEYSAIADNNIYTNLMAQRNLVFAADLAARFDERAAALGVGAAERDRWRKAAAEMIIPYDRELGVHPQAEDFTRHDRWNFEATGSDQYPLLLHFPYFDLYRKQVVKQPDLVMALFIRGDAFSLEEKARNFDYYEALTVRDSSLSACVQSIVAAEVGQLELAYDYLGEAALIDLDDLEHNTRDGLHIASLAGTWLALVLGLGGMRNYGQAIGAAPGSGDGGDWAGVGGGDGDGASVGVGGGGGVGVDGSGRGGGGGRGEGVTAGLLTFAPRLPPAITRLRFRLTYLGRRLEVAITAGEATYTLRYGDQLELAHHGTPLWLRPGQPETRAIPTVTPGPPPTQPPGRVPERRVATPAGLAERAGLVGPTGGAAEPVGGVAGSAVGAAEPAGGTAEPVGGVAEPAGEADSAG
jgi:alpha,alpha-trehalose phosphorylase